MVTLYMSEVAMKRSSKCINECEAREVRRFGNVDFDTTQTMLFALKKHRCNAWQN